MQAEGGPWPLWGRVSRPKRKFSGHGDLEERAHRDGAERPRLQPDQGHEHHRHPPADGGDQGVRRPFSRKSRNLRLKSPFQDTGAAQTCPDAENPENRSTSAKNAEEA